MATTARDVLKHLTEQSRAVREQMKRAQEMNRQPSQPSRRRQTERVLHQKSSRRSR